MTSHKSYLAILVAPFILLFISCGVNSNELPPTEVTGFSPGISTELPTFNVNLTPTMSTNGGDIRYACVDIQTDNLQLHTINGTLVLLEEGQSSENLLFLNLDSGEEKILPPEDTGTFSVSPKGTYLAHDSWLDNRNRMLKISDSTGNVLTTINEPEDWYGFEWLNDENLLINYPIKDNPLILLSPLNHEQKTLQAYVRENSYIFSPAELIYDWGFYAYHRNVYDRHLTRILYPSYNDNNGGPIVVIRDLASNKDLATFSTNVGWGVSPRWSPDGEKIAIGLNTNTSAQVNGANEYEIFVIGRDGEILLSTNLTSLSKTVYTSFLSWSPDSRYIAFRYTTSNDINEELELAVLDTLTKQITNYCLTSDIKDLSFVRGDPSPIWSPNSDFLLIETIEPDTQMRNVLIVDIKTGQAHLIKTGLTPIGWMK